MFDLDLLFFSPTHLNYDLRSASFSSADGDALVALEAEGRMGERLLWTDREGQLNVETDEGEHGRFHAIFPEEVPIRKSRWAII